MVRAYAAATPTEVVPNGVDLEFFAPSDKPVDPRTVVFNGTLDYRPNLDAVQHLVDDVWPLVLKRCPDARLDDRRNASAEDRQRLQRPSVKLTGQVPDVRPYLESAAVVAVPSGWAGGPASRSLKASRWGRRSCRLLSAAKASRCETASIC